MGFFSNIGEALFGTQTKKQGRELAAQGAANTSQVGQQAKQMGTQASAMGQRYDTGTMQSMGANAQEYMQKANQAAQGQAQQAATTAATQGTQAALQAARSTGLSKGQAALASGQQAGNIYTGAYQQGLESGRQQYNSATQQFAGQGAQMAGRAQNALNTQLGAATGQANIGQQQIANANQTASNTWGTIGTIAGGLATLSDERAKDNIEVIGKFDPDSLKTLLDYKKPEEKNEKSSGISELLPTVAKIAASSGMIASDENAKEGVEEVKPEEPEQPEQKPTIAQGMASAGAGSGSSFGEGFSRGAKIGQAYKENKPEAEPKEAKDVPSDENAKKDIFENAKSTLDNFDVMDIAKKIRPVRFRYKQEVVNNPGEKVGVIAQDLEKTPLASVVKENEDGLKMIDTTELSPAILNLVIQLARRVDKIEGAK